MTGATLTGAGGFGRGRTRHRAESGELVGAAEKMRVELVVRMAFGLVACTPSAGHSASADTFADSAARTQDADVRLLPDLGGSQGRRGLGVETLDRADLAMVKAANGVPGRLASCHTMAVGGYVVILCARVALPFRAVGTEDDGPRLEESACGDHPGNADASPATSCGAAPRTSSLARGALTADSAAASREDDATFQGGTRHTAAGSGRVRIGSGVSAGTATASRSPNIQ